MYKKLLLVLTLITCLFPIAAGAQGLLRGPESVAFDSLRNRYIVCNYTTGTLVAVDTSGAESFYMTGFEHCYGNCICGDTLYFSNGARVYGIDMATDVIFMDIAMPVMPRSYDGMTTDTSGNLYVVYTGNTNGLIYKISISQQTYSLFVSSGLAPYTQDIIFDARNNRILCAGYTAGAPIQAVNMTDGSVSTLVTNTPGYWDGITMDHIGNVYVANSTGGNIYRYNKTFTGPPELISSGHSQPAGIDYNFRDNILAVPNFSSNTLDLVPLTFPVELDSYEFDDSPGGDGDGILEAGETIDLTITITNYRTFPVTGVTVDLTVDDATIGIINGSAYLGDLGSGESADNAGDPFQFTIPADYNARIDSFILDITFNGGSEATQKVVEKGLGQPRIVLVDDDENDFIEDYYIECFSALRIPYDIILTPPQPVTADLDPYELVIWFTGDYRLGLDEYEIAAMEGYLDGGGQLFLTGQGIAALLNLIDQDFMNNYLRADYSLTELIPGLAATPSGQIFAISDSVWLDGSDGAWNQEAPDHLTAVNGGVGDMVYFGTSDFGAVSYSGAYKSLFFGFGFEAIINGSSRWTDRHTIFAEILEFFEYQRPGIPPVIDNLTVSGTDPQHMTDHEPDIAWTFTDFGSGSQAAYQIQTGTDDDWTVAEMWDSGPVAGSEAQAVYAGSPLQDGQTYFIRARASNGYYWSPWLTVVIRMNSVPVAVQLSPDNLQEVIDGEVILTHDNQADLEGDAITYDYEIYEESEMTTLVASAVDQPSGSEPTTTWTPTATFMADADYYWRVRAADDYESGAWSELASFVVVAAYVCGDANADGQPNVADAVYLINYVFKGGDAPVPLEAGDANCDGQPNVADAVYLINYVFKGGDAPCANCP